MRTWRAFRRLTPDERSLAIEAMLALAATRVGLRAAGLRRWKMLVAGPPAARASRASASDGIAQAQKVARIQQAVSRHLIWHASCLERSLALCWQLARRGVAADLRIGARKEAGRFQAHAWVEMGNVVLNDSGEAHLHFAPFDGSILSVET